MLQPNSTVFANVLSPKIIIRLSSIRYELSWKEFRSEDEEINEIKYVIGSSIFDSEVQGGLRWPNDKDSSGGRYVVFVIGHTTAKSYRSSSIRLKLQHADPFDFRYSSTSALHRRFS
uniref:DUF7903 domain-containing protein n=1 Tax=Solanum lycopersicum TaxID=4081 RepID=K4BS51_SOLLC